MKLIMAASALPLVGSGPERMPVIFLAHGSPMLLDSQRWIAELKQWADAMPRPRAVLISPGPGRPEQAGVTMEVIRQMGLEERVRAKSLETYSPTGGIIAVESLALRKVWTTPGGAAANVPGPAAIVRRSGPSVNSSSPSRR